MIARRGSAKKKHAERLAWLSAHPDLYRHVPGINDDVTDAGRLKLEELHQVMDARDLFGASKAETRRETIRRLVSELRGERIDVSW